MWENDIIIFDKEWFKEHGFYGELLAIEDDSAADKFTTLKVKDELNRLGEQGWEPFHVEVENDALTYFFKRWVAGD